MEKRVISYQHQAIYYKVGSISENTRNVWIIFHGYGQLAEEFSASFRYLETNENFLLYPQGLSRFYLKGVGDKIGSSWMTSLDRELEISNYISYLNSLYEIELKSRIEGLKVNILGFSQGGHTASRWISSSHITYDHLIFWGSSLAHEIGSTEVSTSFSSGQNTIVIGDQDRFIDSRKLDLMKKRYDKIGFDYKLVQYRGGHDIYPEILQQLI